MHSIPHMYALGIPGNILEKSRVIYYQVKNQQGLSWLKVLNLFQVRNQIFRTFRLELLVTLFIYIPFKMENQKLCANCSIFQFLVGHERKYGLIRRCSFGSSYIQSSPTGRIVYTDSQHLGKQNCNVLYPCNGRKRNTSTQRKIIQFRRSPKAIQQVILKYLKSRSAYLNQNSTLYCRLDFWIFVLYANHLHVM